MADLTTYITLMRSRGDESTREVFRTPRGRVLRDLSFICGGCAPPLGGAADLPSDRVADPRRDITHLRIHPEARE